MTEATEEERLEALSHRYVDAARVVALATGRYAVFSMARGEIIATVEELGLASAIVEACQRSAQAWELAKAEQLRETPVASVAASAQDLGL